ncbi:MAG: EAL domain-containing protein [Methylotenera sp.]|nr:EAL domain-containing protein [Methylotenera sp.]MDP1959660.1 EAL domain-containing protein [Methylotenera sp.]MDP3302978.1 EAL domain-containing protein [Methylotenera sp.]MDP3943256.1 EAL domain-containing protein [Methylotenera sp.]
MTSNLVLLHPISNMQKKLSTIWRFLLPVLVLLAAAPFILTGQQTAQHLDIIQTNARQQALTLLRLLNVTDELVSEQANAASNLLKQRSDALGKPAIDGSVSVDGRLVPNLKIGEVSLANSISLVDNVSNLLGGTATVFVKSGDNFVRVATNVKQKNGLRALGTSLNPDGKVIGHLRSGQPFHGVVDILGEPYITRYDPLFDDKEQVIGALYVGYKVDMKVLRDTVENMRQLKTGFAVVLDESNKIRFLSSHTKQNKAASLLQARPDNWIFVTEDIPKWGFKVVVTYPLNEARAVGLANSWFVIIAGTLLGALLIAIILWQLRHLILDPIGGDPELAIEVVQRIAAGDLNQDELVAKPNTLMANVLEMRTKLRQTMQALRNNADRMSLSASVFDHAHDGIFITDAEARIIEVNPAFSEITRYLHADAMGHTPQDLGFCTYDPSLLEQLWQVSASDGEWRGETWNRRVDGQVYAAWLDIFTVRDESQNITNYVGLFSDITESKEQQQNLERMAYHDPLTQLPNRALLADRLQQALARSERSGEVLAVCCLDLDGFKPVNDTLGHEAGDYLLVQLAVRMSVCLRDGDTVARLGGDEFAVLLCGLNDIGECEQILGRLLSTIKMPYDIAGEKVSISSSIGYTVFPADNNAPDTLLRHADHAMYQAKVSGGSRIQLFDADHDREFRGLRQDRERIEAALPNGEFRLFYQPKVDLREGKVVGMEALIRWQHPEQGLRPPITFLPIVENTDFSILLGEWVISEALRQMVIWLNAGLDFQVSVNIAALHMVQANFAERLALLLAEFPEISPKKLELEITETAAIEDVAGVAHTINKCKLLGVSFALDDFGVGYSSLTYLRRLPVAVIKIDQSFVRDMLLDADDLAVVAGVISLSRDFKRKVVAEGVETAEQGVWLLRMGCSVVQGYGIARPMPAIEVQAWVEAYQPNASWTQGLL